MPGGEILSVPAPAAVDGIPSYLGQDAVNWDSDLESLHADSTETHFMDVLTRAAVFDAVRRSAPRFERILEVGCSSGFMLRELRMQWPDAALAGIDALADGLATARDRVPDAEIAHASATDLPVADASVDVVHARWAYFFGPGSEPGLRERIVLATKGGIAMGVPYDSSAATSPPPSTPRWRGSAPTASSCGR